MAGSFVPRLANGPALSTSMAGAVYDCTQADGWDAQKARLNAGKHGIQFADAVLVLEDDNALTTTEHAADGEERCITLGVGRAA